MSSVLSAIRTALLCSAGASISISFTVLSHRCLNAGAWPWRIPSHAFRLVGSYVVERQKAREREKKGCTSSHTFMHDALDSWLQGSEWHRENEITIARGRPQCHGSNANIYGLAYSRFSLSRISINTYNFLFFKQV
ncbi:hypothetical protein O6H91_Y259500 [Diphasiastrum complanatum]|nr:hypothetical protein O6H91_Y259500 [Diphasiastrum complanatum]